MQPQLILEQWPSWIYEISVSKTELTAALLSFWCVWLAAKNNVLNWPVAMAGSAIYVVVFFQGALYSDAFLNVVFLFFQGFGWYSWKKSISGKFANPAEMGDHAAPSMASGLDLLRIFAVGALCYYPWTLFVKSGTVQQWISPGSFQPPRFLYLDAALFIVSIIALYMQAKRWIQHWFLWILIDVVYVPVYWQNDNQITALLYTLYIPLAVKGYLLWRVNLQERTAVG